MIDNGFEEGVLHQAHHGASIVEPEGGTTEEQERIFANMVKHSSRQKGASEATNSSSIIQPNVAEGLSLADRLELERIVIRNEMQQINQPIKTKPRR